MKELEGHKLNENKVEIHQDQNQKQEYKFFGTIHMTTGCKLWCYNPETDSMDEVKIIKKGTIDLLSGKVIENKKATYNPKCTYFQAINEKNARRKLLKYRQGDISVAEDFRERKFDKLPDLF